MAEKEQALLDIVSETFVVNEINNSNDKNDDDVKHIMTMTEKERLQKIARMFLAKPDNKGTVHKDGHNNRTNGDVKLNSSETRSRGEKKKTDQNSSPCSIISDDKQTKDKNISAGCFGFLASLFSFKKQKRRRRKQKYTVDQPIKKKNLCVRFSEFVMIIPPSPGDDLSEEEYSGNDSNTGTTEFDGVKIISFI
ncbi:uncharacterized protein LOC132757692 [Ruditapes philippinarum]|uniref:uncharacterized protein LOC132757692 n=1 Tax=Ruditapes philippinarum TaxID=129788 RepID=UPI00295BC794|nr:uncharacterized protein LOC132757692 [Ruditapes philippinarum]